MARNFGNKSEKREMDFELNIASIIDCFTVLITYLLVSASFISLGILDITVAVPASAEEHAHDIDPPKLIVTIALQIDNSLIVHTSGVETKNFPIPALEGNWDFEKLAQTLVNLKKKYPKLEAAMVTADDRVTYKEIVKTVVHAQKTLPNVALSADQIGQWAS